MIFQHTVSAHALLPPAGLAATSDSTSVTVPEAASYLKYRRHSAHMVSDRLGLNFLSWIANEYRSGHKIQNIRSLSFNEFANNCPLCFGQEYNNFCRLL